MSGNLLIVDDDRAMAETLSKAMRSRGFAATWTTSATEALKILDEQDFDVVVTDLHMSGMDGFSLCERIVANRPDIPVVMITAFGTLASAIAAIRVGAYDFITKPFDIDIFKLTMQRAVQHRALRGELKRLRSEMAQVRGTDQMIGSSPPMLKVKDLIERVADSEATVLISGASGTGKELVAQAIHRRSRHADGPFVAINCAAMPEALLESELFGHVKGAFTDAHVARQGLFLKAHGGTLFLDEIGEMPLGMQAKLLRALQEKKVRPVGGDGEIAFDARIVTASNRDLEAEVEARRFRSDLYYRVNVVGIDVPPLRVRGDDILILAQSFVVQYAKRAQKDVTGMSASAAQKLLQYSWPGNVRELHNSIERAVTLTRFQEIVVDDLPERVRDYPSTEGTYVQTAASNEVLKMDEVERRYVEYTLKVVDGNKSLAADLLGIDRRTLHRKISKWESNNVA